MSINIITIYPKRAKLPSCIILDSVRGDKIEDVTFDNISLSMVGGGTDEEANRSDIPEWLGDERPEAYVYKGVLPCVGLFARNVEGLELNNFKVLRENDDPRPDVLIL